MNELIINLALTLLIVSIFGFFIRAGIKEYKETKAELEKDKVDNEAFLAAEQAKPRAILMFYNCATKESLCETGFEPMVDFYYPKWIRFTSQDVAKSHLKECYRRGYFQTNDGTTVPTCNIAHAYVATVERPGRK